MKEYKYYVIGGSVCYGGSYSLLCAEVIAMRFSRGQETKPMVYEREKTKVNPDWENTKEDPEWNLVANGNPIAWYENGKWNYDWDVDE